MWDTLAGVWSDAHSELVDNRGASVRVLLAVGGLWWGARVSRVGGGRVGGVSGWGGGWWVVLWRVGSGVHRVEVAAPAGVVYGLLADAGRWPVVLPWYVHVERMDFDGSVERLHLWELRGGRVCTWHARRVLHPHAYAVDFEQYEPARPGAVVSGSWRVEAVGAERSLLTLRQERTLDSPH
ncbi:aromatase/cyclase, partial [Streptomyces sp. NPDC005485]|uniref:aromatase/cyclase n=1 Tax=Streptomyces sp. NPDC005485 TaxID=3155591 RepID=UPI0033BABA65